MASHRRTLAAAVAVVLASLSLYPIYIGTGWFFAGIGSAIVVALAGTLARLRRLPVVADLAIGVLALLLYLNVTFSNARSYLHLLPTPASLAALWHIAGQGFNEAAKYAPPVPELRGMVLLAAAGIGIAALLTDLIAVRLGSAALAGLPLLLLFTEPFTLSLSRGFVGTTVAFIAGVAGYLGLLSSEARDRIREWEHPGPADTDAPDTRALAATGRRVGFAAVAIALFIPLFVPGLHMTRLFGNGQPGIGGNGGGATVAGFPDPNTQLSQELKETQAMNMLAYATTDNTPSYLQIYVLDQLTDTGWHVLGQPASHATAGSKLPAPPGLSGSAEVARETTRITIAKGVRSDAYDTLPVPFPATTVTVQGSVRADPSTLMVFDPGVTLGGLSYTVESLDESPSAAALNAAPPPMADITSRDMSVPASYDSLRALARSVVRLAGAKTEFQEAVALQDWLAGGTFSYTLHAPSVVDAAGLTKFLTVTKTGYCQQFSSAMAVLARLLGIPARVAFGFTPGTPVSTNEWLVTSHDAHAWPELYFQGYGWLRFEPTPTGPNGQGSASTPDYASTSVGSSSTGQPTTGPSTAPSANPTGISPGLRHLLTSPGGVAGSGTGGGVNAGGADPWVIFGLTIAGLAALALIAPVCGRLVVRRRRWRHRTAGGAHGAEITVPSGSIGDLEGRVRARDVAWAHAAWQELRDDLIDYGAGYQPSESPRTVATRAGSELSLGEPARAALGRIAMAEERARYAARPTDGSGLRADSTAVRRAIAAAVPRGERWRARLLPASVVGPAMSALSTATDALGRLGPGWLGRFRG
ncbi:MAG TPA: transglutaminaseTgpA domain-containing protein [Trebonia sp.]|nr:transglutaminaseTgpA domain-containing protein [Trebonia sp.]